MDKYVRSIVEDLLPLYTEDLLQDSTKAWVDEQLKEDTELRDQLTQAETPLIDQEEQDSTVDYAKMIQKTNRKLALYQLIFVALSFFLAIKTSLLNGSFEFILWYTLLGFLTYVFYKDMKIVFYMSFIPIFIWSFGVSVSDYIAGEIDLSVINMSFVGFFLSSAWGSVIIAGFHYLFALIGSTISLLIVKIKAEEGN
ncbi:hypothetical protein [Lentibacillus saliphilus]|uniref:hypothetical protein n=1 Tax=Lentibacillus saliphilus TaxID=2737028 RepID=UPI001FE4A744|nr:hypothetical protein [Lentibacillus saliphilus]